MANVHGMPWPLEVVEFPGRSRWWLAPRKTQDVGHWFQLPQQQVAQPVQRLDGPQNL